MRSRAVLLFVLCSALVSPAELPGQQPAVYEAGAILKIEAPGYTPGRIDAMVQGYTHEGLVIEDRHTGDVYRIPQRTDILYLAHYRGLDRWYSAKKYGVAGGFLLGSVGAIGGALLAVDREDDNRILMWAGASAAAGAITGTLLGGALGAVLAREEWKVYGLSPAWRDSVGHPGGVQFRISAP
jgi:hypothetical protein